MTSTNKTVPVKHSYTVLWNTPSPECSFIQDMNPFLHSDGLWERRVNKIKPYTKCFSIKGPIKTRIGRASDCFIPIVVGINSYIKTCFLFLIFILEYLGDTQAGVELSSSGSWIWWHCAPCHIPLWLITGDWPQLARWLFVLRQCVRHHQGLLDQ